MSRFIRLIILFILCSLLISCAILRQHKDEEDDDAALKLKTAKINTQLGIAYLERHNIQRAKQKLLLALEQAPDTPEPWYAMGYFLEATGNKMDARTYYLRAVEIAPERGDVQNNYGTYLCRRGNYQGAIQHFMLAVKDRNYLDPSDAYENAGMCAMKIPNYRAARKYFNIALLEDPSRPNALIGLAELDYRIGSYHAASRQLSAFLTLSSATPQSSYLGMMIEQKLASQAKTTILLPKTISMDKNRSIQDKKMLISSINTLLETKKHPTPSSNKSKMVNRLV